MTTPRPGRAPARTSTDHGLSSNLVSDRLPRRTLKLADGHELGNQVQASLRASARPTLIVISGRTVGERVSVTGNVIIGRDPASQLVLPDPGVSYRHACLEDRGGSWTLVDLGSTNGTEVNGQPSQQAPLKHGDRLRFGQTLVRFELQDETDQAYTEAVALLLNTDDLTGLLLRRRFDAELALLLSQASACAAPLSLLAMDLDGIKSINDQHGHLFGAYTIAETGRLIGRLLSVHGPARAIACRFGGDEFVAALPNHTLEQAFQAAERIREAVSQHPYCYENVELRPAISIGVAQFPLHGSDSEALFRHADAALYRAKRNGKNRVECAAPR